MLIGLWLGRPAGAIENLDAEFASASAREFEVAPGHRVFLSPGQVLIRGHLQAGRSRTVANETIYGVRDEMVDQRVFNRHRDGYFLLHPGDQLFVLDPAREKILLVARYDQITEPVVYTTPGQRHTITTKRPLLRFDVDQSTGVLSERHLQTLFSNRQPVVLVSSLSESEFDRARGRYLPLIRAHEAHRQNPDRLVRITADHTVELAHFETAHAGRFSFAMPGETAPAIDFGAGRVQPAMKIWELILSIVTPDGRKLRLNKNETMIMIGSNDDVVLTHEMEDERLMLYEPYDETEQKLCDSLLFVDRAVIIKPK